MENLKDILTINEQIITAVSSLRMDWSMIALLTCIEKFDTIFSQITLKESAVFAEMMVQDYIPLTTVIDLIIEALKGCTNSNEAIGGFNTLMFWYETEIEIQPLIKSLLLGHFIQSILFKNAEENVALTALISALIDSGYSWVKYIRLSIAHYLEVNDWVMFFLSALRDGQQMLLHKIDLGGTAQKLTSSERLLVHIIENHAGINTNRIARKLGKSEPTVRRLLAKLRNLQLITTHGSGHKVYHEIVISG